MVRTLLRVTGTVQGVGFRPFVYRHAVALGLVGTVRNDSEGVLIDVEGDPAGVAALERVLTESPPPLARVASVEARPVAPDGERDDFRIVETDAVGPLATAVSIDTAACDDCLAEVDDPGDRRYRYPFTNCTNCGPRYTITRRVPYDRPTTTMAGFSMCARCRAEYDDPGDRRFHAQPNACPDCGPRASWRDAQGVPGADGDDALDAAVAALGERGDRRREGDRWLPPGRAGRRRGSRRRAPAAQGTRRQAVRGDGGRRHRRRRGRCARRPGAGGPHVAGTTDRDRPATRRRHRSRPRSHRDRPTSGCSSRIRRSIISWCGASGRRW